MVNHRRVASEDRHRNHGIVQILLAPFHMSIIDELKYTSDLFQYLTDSTDVIGRAFPLFYLCLRLFNFYIAAIFVQIPSTCNYSHAMLMVHVTWIVPFSFSLSPPE